MKNISDSAYNFKKTLRNDWYHADIKFRMLCKTKTKKEVKP